MNPTPDPAGNLGIVRGQNLEPVCTIRPGDRYLGAALGTWTTAGQSISMILEAPPGAMRWVKRGPR
jgi:hypothetical protein